MRVIEGDVLDRKALEAAMAGQDVVYANLAGQLEQQAQCIVSAMEKTGVKRLLFISSMGIYEEVPGECYRSILDPYRNAAHIIEASGLDYTIIRPAWLNNHDEIDYGTTHKGESFKNASEVVSRKSVADLVVKLATRRTFKFAQALASTKHREANIFDGGTYEKTHTWKKSRSICHRPRLYGYDLSLRACRR